MKRIVIASVLVAVAAVAVAKLAFIPAADPAQARALAAEIGVEPAIDAAAITRAAPRDLPVEAWSPI